MLPREQRMVSDCLDSKSEAYGRMAAEFAMDARQFLVDCKTKDPAVKSDALELGLLHCRIAQDYLELALAYITRDDYVGNKAQRSIYNDAMKETKSIMQALQRVDCTGGEDPKSAVPDIFIAAFDDDSQRQV